MKATLQEAELKYQQTKLRARATHELKHLDKLSDQHRWSIEVAARKRATKRQIGYRNCMSTRAYYNDLTVEKSRDTYDERSKAVLYILRVPE